MRNGGSSCSRTEAECNWKTMETYVRNGDIMWKNVEINDNARLCATHKKNKRSQIDSDSTWSIYIKTNNEDHRNMTGKGSMYIVVCNKPFIQKKHVYEAKEARPLEIKMQEIMKHVWPCCSLRAY